MFSLHRKSPNGLLLARARRLIAAGGILLAAGCSASHATETAPAAPPAAASPVVHASPALLAATEGSIADVVESVLPSVVSVTSTKHARASSRQGFFFGGPRRGGPQQGLGSGVILSADGLVVTNNHVIEGADAVVVQLHDEREFEARVIGADPKTDVAVLQLEGEITGLMPVRIGDSTGLRLGDVVLAVGNPFGVGQTVTMGIVSATGRSDMGIVDYENFIQTDAAINPGNSGGALINMRGELVGINTAILSRSGGSVGIGFAIPTNMAQPIIEALKADGEVSRGWLGVRIQDLDAELVAALSLSGPEGVLISDVQGEGPASKAGLQSGDVVTHVGKSLVMSAGQFRNLIASAGAEAQVVLKLVRGGKKQEISVHLGTLPNEAGEAKLPKAGKEKAAEVEGLALKSVDAPLRRRLKLSPEVKGAVIIRVTPGSKAARAKLRPGDVILQINQKSIVSAAEALEHYKTQKGRKLLQILRGGSKMFIVMN